MRKIDSTSENPWDGLQDGEEFSTEIVLQLNEIIELYPNLSLLSAVRMSFKDETYGMNKDDIFVLNVLRHAGYPETMLVSDADFSLKNAKFKIVTLEIQAMAIAKDNEEK